MRLRLMAVGTDVRQLTLVKGVGNHPVARNDARHALDFLCMDPVLDGAIRKCLHLQPAPAIIGYFLAKDTRVLERAQQGLDLIARLKPEKV